MLKDSLGSPLIIEDETLCCPYCSHEYCHPIGVDVQPWKDGTKRVRLDREKVEVLDEILPKF